MTKPRANGIDRELSVILGARILVQSRLSASTGGYQQLLFDIIERDQVGEACAGLATLAALLLPGAAAGSGRTEAETLRTVVAGLLGQEKASAEVPDALPGSPAAPL